MYEMNDKELEAVVGGAYASTTNALAYGNSGVYQGSSGQRSGAVSLSTAANGTNANTTGSISESAQGLGGAIATGGLSLGSSLQVY
jgi:bacteriocin-like protein